MKPLSPSDLCCWKCDSFYLKHADDLSQHNGPAQIILCKEKENEQETVGGPSILRNIHHEAWFQMSSSPTFLSALINDPQVYRDRMNKSG